ncbi:hypothetical protein M3Y99_00554700 [Aphelenchoides fujianensis]|nr:hypothetical protein M3Y99_00554700 [Aphelenchoides fujianensis]
MDRTSRKFSASRRGGRGAGGFRPQESMPYRQRLPGVQPLVDVVRPRKKHDGDGSALPAPPRPPVRPCASRWRPAGMCRTRKLRTSPCSSTRPPATTARSALWATVHSANAKAVKFNQVTSFDSELNKREAALAAAEEKGVEKHSGDLFDCLDSCGGLIDHEKKFREIKTYFADTFGSSTDEH